MEFYGEVDDDGPKFLKLCAPQNPMSLDKLIARNIPLILMKIFFKSLWRIRFQTQLTSRLLVVVPPSRRESQHPKVKSWTITQCQYPAQVCQPQWRKGGERRILQKWEHWRLKLELKMKKWWGGETESEGTWRLSCIVKIMQSFWKMCIHVKCLKWFFMFHNMLQRW